jgi:methylase of polypeptide subunit release factors
VPGVDLLPDVQKSRGAFYTDPVVAAFLFRWAARSSADRILEPCFGGGVFLRAAVERIAALGGDPKASVVAVEVDPAVHRAIRESFGREVASGALFEADFFTLDTSRIGLFNCAVGNPPFIRSSGSMASSGRLP